MERIVPTTCQRKRTCATACAVCADSVASSVEAEPGSVPSTLDHRDDVLVHRLVEQQPFANVHTVLLGP